MRPHSRGNQLAFRRAVVASVALHVVAACALLVLLRTGEPPKPAPRGLDTRAAAEPQVRMHLVDDAPLELEVQAGPASAQPQAANPLPDPAPVTPQVVARTQPHTLPAELLALLRRPAPVEAPALPGAGAVRDPNVKPAGATGAASVPALHGAMKPNQTVVYVLDCSGSMGAAGKFDLARDTLAATLRHQPPTVRFQVIVYAGSAVPLLASGRPALPASEANVRAAAEKLAALEARGKSSHLEAVRAALAFRPDVIVILTDADDLSATKLKPVLADEPRPVPVCVGHVTAAGVQRLRELK